MICVLDDDKAVRHSMCVLLEAHGFAVEAYANASELLEHMPSAGGTCLLLDLYMPGVDAVSMLRALKQRGSDVPVIVITARPESPVARRALKAGARAVLSKPVEEDVLLETIHAVFETELASGDHTFQAGTQGGAGRNGLLH